ncbi:MAG: hypothetical protein ACOCXO_03055 [Bacteroidota bacterium]
MELGDIINFLLVIAFVVVAPLVSALSKKNKQKQNATLPSENARAIFDEEGLEDARDPGNLQQSYEERRKNEESGNVYPTVDNEIEEKSDNWLQKSPKSPDINNDARQGYKQVIPGKRAHKSKAEAAMLAKSFDIKKAVIYSEIINTKYF